VFGQDTTAGTVSWAIHFITEHPEVQSRIRDEVDRELAGRPAADFATVGSLAYVDAVVQEAMRIRPVVPLMFLEPYDDEVISGVAVPAGSPILLLTGYFARHDSYFNESARFDPQRWSTDPARTTGTHDTRAYMPFGAGPRFCPGAKLATLEAKAVIAMAAGSFEISRAPGAEPVAELFTSTVQPLNIKVRLASRP
jgi:cytochrome P450